MIYYLTHIHSIVAAIAYALLHFSRNDALQLHGFPNVACHNECIMKICTNLCKYCMYKHTRIRAVLACTPADMEACSQNYIDLNKDKHSHTHTRMLQ